MGQSLLKCSAMPQTGSRIRGPITVTNSYYSVLLRSDVGVPSFCYEYDLLPMVNEEVASSYSRQNIARLEKI